MSTIKIPCSYNLLSSLTLAFSASLLLSSAVHAASTKVAFIGDQGVGENAQSVLSLVANEGVDLLLIQGDLGYDDNSASTWENNLNNALGENFPVLTVVGNHENFEWPLYQRLIQKRIDRIAELSCSGNVGVKAKCSYDNIEVVQVSPGVYEVPGIDANDNYAEFIQSSFAGTSDRWRICSWHKPHHMFQTGSKTGPPDWNVYDACLDAGAMIALAHEHAYSRTYLLNDFRNQSIVHKSSEMELKPGQSFAFVSGLGGREARVQKRGGDYFASIYTASQGAKPGALFCEFEDKAANCYFKAINGAVPDQFSLIREGGNFIVAAFPERVYAESGVTSSGYVFSRTDKNEYRWIDRNSNGQAGSTWIDATCAIALGGATASGDWSDLMAQAPEIDSIANPCFDVGMQEGGGFVFSRIDKDEYRWIERNASGIVGSVWIDASCADEIGGVQRSGDWKELMSIAPGLDTVDSPCY